MINLSNSVEKPTARTMAAMIGRREFRLLGVFSLEHSRRMRDANKKHCIFARLGRGIVKRTSRMLLEHVVDMLHARHVAFANAIHSLVQPADCRSQGDAVIPNFSFAL